MYYMQLYRLYIMHGCIKVEVLAFRTYRTSGAFVRGSTSTSAVAV